MGFTPRTTAPTRDERYFYEDNPYYTSGFGLPNCTTYAFGRVYQLLGKRPELSLRNAESWYNDSVCPYERGQKPKLGAVIVWAKGVVGNEDDGAGHVAIVEYINSDGSIRTSNSAYNSTFFYMQNIPNTYYLDGYRFLGFIYPPYDFYDEPEYDEVPTPHGGNRFLSLDEMKDNAVYIWAYLSKKGWSLNAVCGMLGNMQRESTINPAIWQNLDEGNTSLGYGLVQWTPATNYLNWAEDRGLDPSAMDSNLERILYELDNGLQYYSTEAYPESFKEYSISTKSIEYLVTAFLKNYERAGVEALSERISNGEYWYEYLKDFNFGSGTTPDGPHRPILFNRKKGFKFVLFRRYRW